MKIAKFITINVGLHVNGSEDPIFSPGAALNILRSFGFDCTYWRHDRAVLKDRTEETLVVMVPFVGDIHYFDQQLYFAADYMSQDCIAYAYEHDGRLVGKLVGPNAAAWGEFDLNYFLPYDDAIGMADAA